MLAAVVAFRRLERRRRAHSSSSGPGYRCISQLEAKGRAEDDGEHGVVLAEQSAVRETFVLEKKDEWRERWWPAQPGGRGLPKQGNLLIDRTVGSLKEEHS